MLPQRYSAELVGNSAVLCSIGHWPLRGVYCFMLFSLSMPPDKCVPPLLFMAIFPEEKLKFAVRWGVHLQSKQLLFPQATGDLWFPCGVHQKMQDSSKQLQIQTCGLSFGSLNNMLVQISNSENEKASHYKDNGGCCTCTCAGVLPCTTAPHPPPASAWRDELQIACHARWPTAPGLCVNFTGHSSRFMKGKCSTTEHAPGFPIFPHFFLFCDIRGTVGGCRKWRGYGLRHPWIWIYSSLLTLWLWSNSN